MGNLRTCETFRMRKSSGMFKLYFVKQKKALYNSSIFCLLSEDENSTRQTGRETYDFHSPGSIGEWASAKGKPCCMVIFSFWREFLQGTFQKTSLLTVIFCYKTRNKKNRKRTGNTFANHSEKTKIEAKPTISFYEQVHKEFPRATESIFHVGFYSRHAFKVEKERHGDVLWVTIDINVFAR